MESFGTFPFGAKVHCVTQADRTPKKYFVLGGYASAVHACWLSTAGKIITKSLPVTNEPEILWSGDPIDANAIINRINIPEPAGGLTFPGKWLNGGVGRLFNVEMLKPLGIFRPYVWIALLIPFTIANKSQRKALNRYSRLANEFNLPPADLKPSNKKTYMIDQQRIDTILDELEQSKAEIIITLGDLPLHHFIRLFDPTKRNLDCFEIYGKLHQININQKSYQLLPLYQPKVGENIGSYTTRWKNIHHEWLEYDASQLGFK